MDSKEVASLSSIRLYKAIIDRYHEDRLVPTHQCRTVPIDGIFISGSIAITFGGYLPFRMVNSDYRAL